MERKKLGLIVLSFSIFVGIVLYILISQLQAQSVALNCSVSSDCIRVDQSLNLSHIAVGLVVALFSFGIYLLTFHRGSDEILARLDAAALRDERTLRLDTIMKVLDPAPAKVLSTIVASEGITQHMLVVRTGFSKALVSQIVSDFEKKGLLHREVRGKSYAIYLKKEI